MFMTEMKSMQVPLSKYAPQTYDAVWAIALALRGAETAWSKTTDATLPLKAFFSRNLLSLKKSRLEGEDKRTNRTASYKYAVAARNFKNQIPSTSLFSLGHFDYTRKDMAEEFLQQLGHLNFLGVSVRCINIQSSRF